MSSTTITAPSGSQGSQGAQGAQGSQGAQGAQGAGGASGNQGSSGAQGSQGAQGAQGASPTGAQGSPGSQGAQGAQGSNYAADAWDFTWTGSQGTTGWTTGGTATKAVDTLGGKTAWHISGAAGTQGTVAQIMASPATSNCEFRAQFYMSAISTAGTYSFVLNFVPFGGRRISLTFNGTGMTFSTSGAGASLATTRIYGVPLSQWLTITVRVMSPDTTESQATAEVWVGETRVFNVGLLSFSSTGQAAGTLGVERWGLSGTTGETGMAWCSYRNGLNSAPPSWTYRGLGYAPSATG